MLCEEQRYFVSILLLYMSLKMKFMLITFLLLRFLDNISHFLVIHFTVHVCIYLSKHGMR